MNWAPVTESNREKIAPHYLPWLEKPFILSKALRKICNEFRVEVISQGVDLLSDEEMEILGSKDMAYCYLRQVYLLCDNVPYVFARTCIPQETLFKNREAFENLGTKPIGETLLYNRSEVTRGEFEVKVSDINADIFEKMNSAYHSEEEIWGRRSLFSYHGSPLLISEFFLSSIPSYYLVGEGELK